MTDDPTDAPTADPADAPTADPADPAGPLGTAHERLVFETAARTGRVLMATSAPTTEVVRAVRGIAAHEHLGELDADVTYNQLSLIRHRPGGWPQQWIEAVGPRAFDYGRYTEASRLLDDYLEDRTDLDGLAAGLTRIEGGVRRYPWWANRLAAGAAGITTATIFGAGAVAAFAAFLANMLIEWMFGFFGRHHWPEFILQIVTGMLAVGAAAAVNLVSPGTDSSQVVVAVIILTLCGRSSTGAVQDLITGWHLTGAGRFLAALILTLGLVIGIRLGLDATAALGLDLVITSDVQFAGDPAWLMILVSAAVACAFSLYAQMPARTLPVLAATTAVGWTSYSTLLGLSTGPVMAAGIAAMFAGFTAPLLATWIRVPTSIIASIAIIPLFPGIILYRAMLAGLGGEGSTMELMVLAVGTAGALACGVMVGQHLGTLLVDLARRTVRRTSTFLPHLRESRGTPGTAGRGRRRS